jgi:hypothetical protein
MSKTCAIPGCERAAPRGNPICVEDYFALPPSLARMIVRAAIERDRAVDETRRAAHAATLERYLQLAGEHLPEKPVATPVEPDAWAEIGYGAFNRANEELARAHARKRRELLDQLHAGPGGESNG